MMNAERLIEALAGALAGDEVEVDEATVDGLVEALRPLAAPQVDGAMIGRGTVEREFEGVEGLRAAWSDWLSGFERVRFEIEGVEALGENVVTIARQVGTTRHGVDVKQPSAAVWKFRDDRLVRVEFHLDRDLAYASAEEPA